jgi:ZIP family zinc transporter
LSQGQILVLGAIAGLTIFLGLPFGRMRRLSTSAGALLSAIATGILLFLLWDVLSAGVEPVEAALNAAAIDHDGSWARFVGLAAIFVGCFTIGLMSLVYFDQLVMRRRRTGFRNLGAAAIAEYEVPAGALSPAQVLSLMIATGIGLHNFSEGLAIGQSAANDEIKLALLLVIGFGLHNSTEGFGIVGPLCAEADRPSWGFLGVMGLIAGGPTFLGTLVGQSVVNDTLNMAFLALAAGSILYVVVQLLNVGFKLGHKEMLMWGLFAGIVLGFGTDLVLVAAGA